MTVNAVFLMAAIIMGGITGFVCGNGYDNAKLSDSYNQGYQAALSTIPGLQELVVKASQVNYERFGK